MGNWQGQCYKAFVRDQFMDLYQPKLNLFINEMVNVFTTPFILMFTLPNSVDKLLQFVQEYSDYIDGVGDICCYARFDFKRLSSSSTTSSNNDEQQIATLNNKKLESSLLTFAINNPKWRSNEHQSLVLQGITGINIQNKSTTTTTTSTPTNSKPSASTAQLGLTFSELLSSPRHSQLFDITHSNIQIDKIPNPPNIPNLFNNLQRFNYNNHNNNIFLQTSHHQQPKQQQLMLSEINESDSPQQPQQSDSDMDEDEEYGAAPYKTLAMEASIGMEHESSTINQNDSHQQQK